MRPIRALILLLALLAAAPAVAQALSATVSAGPDKVSLTLYRGFGGDEPLDLHWLRGYALVTETRTVRIPAGRSIIRFEGVAGGMLPESVVISGLPDGVLEKNLDADLLSPRTLYGHSFGRPVTLTHRNADGTMTSEPAIIRSAPDGAAIFETRDGFIAADCTGSEAIVYDAVPEGLSAKPTLSIETHSIEAREVTLTLSYLAWGFDWQVNYVATMRPDGKSADLVAWVTLASSDVTSFADAEAMVVAGTIEREDDGGGVRDRFAGDRSLTFRCMPTPVIEAEDIGALPDRSISAALARVPGVSVNSNSVVDAITAEDLGDVKLYRIPDRTTVASNGQKQVQLFDRPGVPVRIVYRADVDRDYAGETEILLRADNKESAGLGVPLPQGNLALFEPLGERRLLVGEARMRDLPVGQPVELAVGESAQVQLRSVPVPARRGWEDRAIAVTNANPYPVTFEARIAYGENGGDAAPKPRRLRGDAALTYKNGDAIWTVEVPANATVTLRLRK